eukprot:356220-Chlamydomonas_euryale.AAC.2
MARAASTAAHCVLSVNIRQCPTREKNARRPNGREARSFCVLLSSAWRPNGREEPCARSFFWFHVRVETSSHRGAHNRPLPSGVEAAALHLPHTLHKLACSQQRSGQLARQHRPGQRVGASNGARKNFSQCPAPAVPCCLRHQRCALRATPPVRAERNTSHARCVQHQRCVLGATQAMPAACNTNDACGVQHQRCALCATPTMRAVYDTSHTRVVHTSYAVSYVIRHTHV